MEELQIKLKNITDNLNNKLENKLKNKISEDSINQINFLLDDIIDELNYNNNLQKENVDDNTIIKMNKYKKDKQFINNFFPLFNYLYEKNNF